MANTTAPVAKGRWAWYHSLWFRIIRLPMVLLIITGSVGCCVLQWSGTNAAASLKADPELLKSEVKALTLDFGPRYYSENENLRRCRAYIRERLADAGAQVEEQEYSTMSRTYHNVRGFFGDRSKPRIVVGAHYDACAIGEGWNPGADDNASGVAGLFGLARLLQQQRPQDVCVELVAYSTEEPPFFGTDNMGSHRHAELLRREGVAVKGVLILEMIGYFSDKPGSQAYPSLLLKLFYPSAGNFVSIVGGMPDRSLIVTCKSAMKGAAPLKVTSACIPRSIDMVHLSDHRNYWAFGYKAVMITDTSFYRNPHYHMQTDTWETLDYVRMAHVVTQVHQAVLALGKG